jgi:hypothetical protein
MSAWFLRNADKDKARQQKAVAEHNYQMLMRVAGNDLRKPQAIAYLQQQWLEADVALRSKDILFRAGQKIISAGRRAAEGQISKEATEDRDAVAQAVRGASHELPPEPPPNFGSMSDRELAAWKKKNFR